MDHIVAGTAQGHPRKFVVQHSSASSLRVVNIGRESAAELAKWSFAQKHSSFTGILMQLNRPLLAGRLKPPRPFQRGFTFERLALFHAIFVSFMAPWIMR